MFGAEEATLSEWMEENASVAWVETPEPWLLEQLTEPDPKLHDHGTSPGEGERAPVSETL